MAPAAGSSLSKKPRTILRQVAFADVSRPGLDVDAKLAHALLLPAEFDLFPEDVAQVRFGRNVIKDDFWRGGVRGTEVDVVQAPKPQPERFVDLQIAHAIQLERL